MSEKLRPSFTPVPNVIFDESLRTLPSGAVKVLFAICRYTYGWGKKSDRISLNQLSDMTGMDRANVSRSVRQLGPLVIVTPGQPRTNQASEYRINIDVSDSHLVSKPQQASVRPSVKTPPIQRNPKKEDKSGAKAPASSPHKRSRKLTRAALEQFELTPTLRDWCETQQISQILAAAELPKFVDWNLAKGHRPKNNDAAFRNWLRRAKDFQSNVNGNGHDAKPADVKDLGNGMIEVDGRQMDRKTYERRFANAAN